MPLGPFERTLALRYLRGPAGGGGTFLRFVILAAIGGVAVGTGALLLATMIVRGFSREIEAKIVGFGQHVEVESLDGQALARADSLRGVLEALPHVVAATPAVLDFALLRGGRDAVDGVVLWGTDPERQDFVKQHLAAGTFSFAPDARGRPGLVVGARLAERLGLKAGDRATAFSTRGIGSGGAGGRPRLRAFYVAGIFETGLADFDDQFAFADADAVRALFDYAPGSATRIDLTLDDRAFAAAIASTVNVEVGPPLFARPIEEVYRGLFAWVRLQQSIIPLLISILTIVAAFNVIGVLLMVVLEKAREIGTVLAMGASRAAVRRLFVFLGLMVGIIGSALGATVAVGFGLIQLRYRLIPLPPDAYFLDAAPIEIRGLDVLLVVSVSIALCTLAAYLPARAAARIEPIRTIRLG